MGIRNIFKNPSERDSFFIWKDVRHQNELVEKMKDNKPPTVKHIPETWLPLVAGILMWHHVVLRYLVLS